MSLLSQVSIFFFYVLFFGLFAFWPLVSSAETGRGFHGLISNVGLGGILTLIGISLVAQSQEDPISWLAYASLGLSCFSAILFSLRSRDIKIFELVSFRLKDGNVETRDEDQRDWLDWIIYAACLVGFLSWGVHVYFENLESTLFVLSSMLVMGVTIFMMSLGHYYLVVPKLTEKPLVVGSGLLWVFLVLKIAISAWAMNQHWDYFQEGTRLGDGFSMNWIFATMRMLWGFGALGILNYFAYELAKMRSFQSATGVLYTMVFFAITGELLSGYFYYKFGVAL